MATTRDLIDRHLLYQEGLSPTLAVTARRKFKYNLQRGLDYLWNLRTPSWSLTYTTPTIVVAGGRTYLDVAAADELLSLSPHGIVTVDGRQLTWVPRGRMEQLYLVSPSSGSGRPEVFTDPELTGSGTWAIYVYPGLSSAGGHSAAIAYKSRSPQLKDAGDTPPETGDELLLVPEQWHDCLVYELGVLYEMKDKGNIQAATLQKGIVEMNIRNFLAQEAQGRAGVQQMVGFRPRRTWR